MTGYKSRDSGIKKTDIKHKRGGQRPGSKTINHFKTNRLMKQQRVMCNHPKYCSLSNTVNSSFS